MTNHQWKECQRSFHCEFCSRILPNFKIASNGSDIALPWPAGRAILQGQADSQLEILQLTLANPLLLLPPPFTRDIQHELISTSFTRDVSMHMPVESHKEKKKERKNRWLSHGQGLEEPVLNPEAKHHGYGKNYTHRHIWWVGQPPNVTHSSE